MSSREQMASRLPSSALAGRSGGEWQAAPPGRLLPQHSQPLRAACEKPAPKQQKKRRFWEVVSQRRREQPEGGGRCGEKGGRENRQTPQHFRRQAGWLGRDHWLRPPGPGAPELPDLPFPSFLLAVALICPAGMKEGGDNLRRGAYCVVLPCREASPSPSIPTSPPAAGRHLSLSLNPLFASRGFSTALLRPLPPSSRRSCLAFWALVTFLPFL